MTTELFEAKGNLCSLPGMDGAFTCTAECRPLVSKDYLDLLWTTLAEFPGTVDTSVLIKCCVSVFKISKES